MGRKIPLPKRHFGVRDPLKQREEREEKIKDKINNPPKDVNDQEVSKKFKNFIKLKESAKSEKLKKQTLKTVDDDFQSTKIDLDGIRRHANESDKRFMKRVNQIAHQRRIEAGFAAKYNVDIVRNQETGEIKLKKKPKDEITELMKKRKNEARNGKKKFDDKEPKKEEMPKLTSLQKLKLKKKSKKQEQDDEKSRVFAEFQHEEFKFGETVKEPPSLITPRKALKNETVSRPGQRDLLLSSLLNKTEAVAAPKTRQIFTLNKKIIKGPIDKKGKRKNLPNSTRMVLETERQNAVDLYRQMKKKKPIVPVPNRNLEDF